MSIQGAFEDWFEIGPIGAKLAALPTELERVLGLTSRQSVAEVGREAKVVAPHELPPKPGLSTREGQARLLHDLASIELQAMELAVRGLSEFPDAPLRFREDLAELALDEARHLRLCLQGLNELGFEWGHWPCHLALWNVVRPDDSLIDRVLIVHRYLEGSGLDAGDSILRRLAGVPAKELRETVGLVVSEEMDHVRFGTHWYIELCREAKLDPEAEFAARIGRIAQLAPRRERLARELRLKSGFTEFELAELEKHR
jgi:uncharacterized ferritin-like protein (DUF455 family)